MSLPIVILFSILCLINAILSFRKEKKGTLTVVLLWAASLAIFITDMKGVRSPVYDIIRFLGGIFGAK